MNYLAATTSELREHLFGGNRFTSIGLSNGKKQFSLLLRREVKPGLIIFGENRHRGAFLKGDAFNNDLSANHFSGCHLHFAKDTPIRIAP